ncbi:MAG: 2-oxoacid:ferredoxin oxidoreductase subunit beta [Candidatus Carbobacillus altaicus]|uniref:2-oxoglutarate oxidoreductase, beta subunit n=1 Tax=Candidatus Carbonibacillus altaicus TaxID=2163959 RepID=A0A2R6Y184_9BACL|nr:2-oxoacid:ferredoxin oxidoreductase subunit beta [Candidatus Carbobacillus altaicus]PTQ56446.1 MAG: 2-oxoglutarate oxidoreductase, beta subunit [Candidatus Carbobacillus altaicus]
MATFKDFRNDVAPNWCPGCGDFAVLAAMQRALANLGYEPEQVAVLSGIGCSGRISGYIHAYGFHGVHGRVLPLAQGLKMANRDLVVIAAGGDGDGYAIGLNHTIHAIRRNIDITYLVMDNQIYGLTKGQTSPRSAVGFQTKSTPKGSIEAPIAPLQMALAAGATFVAQGFSSDINQLVNIIEEGIRHPGFAMINIFSPCVTFNKINTYDWFKQNVVPTDTIEGYDRHDRNKAMQTLMETDGMLTGIIYQDQETPSYQDRIPGFRKEPLVKQPLKLEREAFVELLEEFA